MDSTNKKNKSEEDLVIRVLSQIFDNSQQQFIALAEAMIKLLNRKYITLGRDSIANEEKIDELEGRYNSLAEVGASDTATEDELDRLHELAEQLDTEIEDIDSLMEDIDSLLDHHKEFLGKYERKATT